MTMVLPLRGCPPYKNNNLVFLLYNTIITMFYLYLGATIQS